jgi:hypothetical protein
VEKGHGSRRRRVYYDLTTFLSLICSVRASLSFCYEAYDSSRILQALFGNMFMYISALVLADVEIKPWARGRRFSIGYEISHSILSTCIVHIAVLKISSACLGRVFVGFGVSGTAIMQSFNSWNPLLHVHMYMYVRT